MAALPYMQLYVADYLADTAHLSAIEHGAYLLLMFNYWQRGESFKAKDEQTLNKRLASVARLSSDEWENARETLSEFFETSETEWRHHRIDRDLDAVNTKSEKAKAAGKASAASRSIIRSTDVQRTLNHTDTETDTEEKKKPPTGVKKKSANAVAFARFWDEYPKKRSKGQAERAFAKLHVHEQLLSRILAGLQRAKTSRDWMKDGGQFIPHPATWLNARGWEDDVSAAGVIDQHDPEFAFQVAS